MSWFQVAIICGISLAIMIGVAEFLASAHSADRSACLAAGYEWSATKYVCVVNLKKK
jgi:hypothetical protein